MNRSTKRRSRLNPFTIVFVVLGLVIAGCLLAVVGMSLNVSGTATLPNGTTAVVNGPFSCSINASVTEIEAGGHTFAFSPTEITVDGVPVAPFDASVTEVEIDSSYWTATLRVNGSLVPLTK